MASRADPPHLLQELSVEALLEVVSDLPGAVAKLPVDEQRTYLEAQRSVVEARNCADFAEEQIRIL